MANKDNTKILVVIDMQNDFISGSLVNKNAEKIIPGVCDLISKNKWNNIILTRDTHTADYLKTPEGTKLPIEHCIKETAGWCVNDEILKALRDKKYSYLDKSTFGTSAWGHSFGLNDDEVEITVCGTVTSICVVSNALLLKTYFPKATIKVIADCCADITKENHEAALAVMRACQIEVI